MITEFEQRLSAIPRWQIVYTIQKQKLDQHCFRVALAAPRIAVAYFGVAPDDYETLFRINRAALLHDQYEVFSGDVQSPSKQFFDTAAHETHFRSRVLEEDTFDGKSGFKIKSIVKVADIYEMLIFLYTEKAMGNNSVDAIKNEMVNKLRTACLGLERIAFEQMHEHAESLQCMQQDPLR